MLLTINFISTPYTTYNVYPYYNKTSLIMIYYLSINKLFKKPPRIGTCFLRFQINLIYVCLHSTHTRIEWTNTNYYFIILLHYNAHVTGNSSLIRIVLYIL